MKQGKFLGNLSGVVFPDTIRFFKDTNKLSFTVVSKSRHKKKTFCQVDYRGEDAPQIYEKMGSRETYLQVHGEMVNHSKSGELMMLGDDLLVQGEHTYEGIMDISNPNFNK